MEFYGIVSTACSLSYQIYSECSASRGQFKALSNQALSLHDILKTIQGSCRRRNLTDDQLESLKRRIIPLTESLGQVDARLKIYSSLGTSSPKLTDKIAWAAGGGSSAIRDELNTQIIGLTAWNTTVLLQQQKDSLTEPALHVPSSDINIEAQLQVSLVSTPPTTNSVQASPQPTEVPKKSPSRLRFIVDGVQLIIFTFLTLLGVGIILIIMCFYWLTMLAFPFFVCIPSLCMGKRTGWTECNGFWKDLLYSVWAFIRGLWD